jgi:hypothetical protein
MSEPIIETHPVQGPRNSHKLRCPKVVTLRAYEVCCHEFGAQDAMVTGECRGGFGAGELIAFLYARSFPKEEWHARVREAYKGMENF